MHFNFPFSVLTVLWTLTFAAHLVLLVVVGVLGYREGWFTVTNQDGKVNLQVDKDKFKRDVAEKT